MPKLIDRFRAKNAGEFNCTVEDFLSWAADDYRDPATTPEEREMLLDIHIRWLDGVEAKMTTEAAREKLRVRRLRHYRGLLLTEVPTTDGIIDDPADLRRITDREVAAGRMSEDDDLRHLAVHGVPRQPEPELLQPAPAAGGPPHETAQGLWSRLKARVFHGSSQ